MKISANTAEHYIWGNQCDGWLLVDREGVSVIQEKMPPGMTEVRHYHRHARQFFYVLSGTATMEVDGETVQLEVREGIEIAPGVPHQMMNRSEEVLEFLVISVPHAHGDRVVL